MLAMSDVTFADPKPWVAWGIRYAEKIGSTYYDPRTFEGDTCSNGNHDHMTRAGVRYCIDTLCAWPVSEPPDALPNEESK